MTTHRSVERSDESWSLELAPVLAGGLTGGQYPAGPVVLQMRVELTGDQLEQIARRAAQLVLGHLPAASPESPYLNIVETARYLRTSRQRVDDLLSARRLTRIKDGNRTLIARTELEAYLRLETRRGRSVGSRDAA